jgi:hypothetical protein
MHRRCNRPTHLPLNRFSRSSARSRPFGFRGCAFTNRYPNSGFRNDHSAAVAGGVYEHRYGDWAGYPSRVLPWGDVVAASTAAPSASDLVAIWCLLHPPPRSRQSTVSAYAVIACGPSTNPAIEWLGHARAVHGARVTKWPERHEQPGTRGVGGALR